MRHYALANVVSDSSLLLLLLLMIRLPPRRILTS